MVLFKRDADASTVEIGVIEYDNGWKFGFDGFDGLKDRLKKGVQFEGKLLKGKRLFNKLPCVLRGDRLWVAAQ